VDFQTSITGTPKEHSRRCTAARPCLSAEIVDRVITHDALPVSHVGWSIRVYADFSWLPVQVEVHPVQSNVPTPLTAAIPEAPR